MKLLLRLLFCLWASASWAQGVPEALTLSGNSAGAAPTPSTGTEGNYFTDTSTGNIWGPKSSGQWPTTPAYSFSANVTQKPPNASLDWTRGYVAQGTIQQVVPTALGSGYTIATAFQTGSCTTIGAIQPTVFNGQIVAYKQLSPTLGCPAGAPPTITVIGDGSGATATAQVAPVGSAWIDQVGNYYRLLRDTIGAAVWQRQFSPASALAADIVPGAVWAVGEDRLHAGATKSMNIARLDLGTNLDIGFVGNGLDYGSLDTYMGGVATTLNTFYDQIGTNNAVGQASPGTLSALTVKVGGSGYTQGAAVTFANLPCTTQPSATANVTSGAITSFTITGAGSKCAISSTTTASVAGGTGATFSILIAGQPSISPVPLVGNGGRVVFDNVVETNSLSGNYRTPGGVVKDKQGLTFPTLAVTSNSATIVALVSFGHSNRRTSVVELSGANPFSLNQSTSLNGLALNYLTTNTALVGYHSPITGRVIGVASGSTSPPGIQIFANDGTTASYKTAGSSSSLVGGVLGCSTVTLVQDGTADSDCGYIVIRDVVIFGRALSATEFQQVSIALDRAAGIYPQVRINDLSDSDSIYEGAYGSYLQSWPRLMGAQLTQPVNLYDTGISGQTSTQDVATIPSWISLCSLPGATLYHNGIGINSVTGGVLDPAIETDVSTLFQTASAAGCGPLYLQTILPFSGATSAPAQEAVRQAVNSWERVNAQPLNATIVDIASDQTMGLQANTLNTAFFQDGKHPGDVWNGNGEGQGGYPYQAALHAAPVNSWLRGR